MRKLVGENFLRLRKERGLTQEQVGERSGFSQWYISKLESGRSNPTIISLYELANAIGVRVVDLIADEGVSAGDSNPPSGIQAADADPKPKCD